MLHTPIDLQGEVADVHNAGAVVGEGGLVGDQGDMVDDLIKIFIGPRCPGVQSMGWFVCH